MKVSRLEFRRLRRSLDPRTQKANSIALTRNLKRAPEFNRSQRIAFYISADGEIDPSHLLHTALERGKRCFLPVLRDSHINHLWFIEYRANDRLRTNRFGIPEPDLRHRPWATPWSLDLILLPLVAFDSACNRLGMGGGYYDKTLSYLHTRRIWRKPVMIGLAHECQHAESIERREWDIAMNAIATEQRI
ncbi:MAG TPA: 5-formyltetrahydrofolate cyclo-ligase, partial [Chromatiales bacterium]|nr:5-formyltetrahydrofolate cyclo-ligase [Chromatiales bacterium]